MTVWHIHFLNARHALTADMAEIRACARKAVAQVGAIVELPRFDLMIRGEPGGGIPDWGVGGRAPAPGVIEVTVSPGRFAPRHLMRVLVHEMHHMVRWEGPGYGRSLGEALVSEGLAGHFVQQVLGGEPDPWDATRPGAGTLRQAGHMWARREFDFAEWFLGRGKIRKWSGYGIGHRLIAEYLSGAQGEDAASLAWMPADSFRPALRRLLAAEGIEAPEDEPEDQEEACPDPLDEQTPAADVEVPPEVLKVTAVASGDAGGPAPRTPPDS